MDRVSDYRTLIKRLLLEKLELYRRFAPEGHEQYCALDEERDQYLLINTGWIGERRPHGATLYLRIQDNKIWIEEDWTEEGVATEFLTNGVQKEEIVLGFNRPGHVLTPSLPPPK